MLMHGNGLSVAGMASAGFLAAVALSPFVARRIYPSTSSGWGDKGWLKLLQVAVAATLLIAPPGLMPMAAGLVAMAIVLGGRVLSAFEQPCNCFGAMPEPSRAFQFGLVLLALAAAGSLVAAHAQDADSGSRWIPVAVAAAVLTGFHVHVSAQRYRSYFYRPDKATGPRVETLAMDDVLGIDEAGRPFSLQDAMGSNQAAFLAFVSPVCRTCHELVRGLSALHDAWKPAMNVVFVSTDAKAFENGASAAQLAYLLDRDMGMARRVQAPAMPAAIAVSNTGEIVMPVVQGMAQVRSLYETVVGVLGNAHE
jgi:hypothetical protein